MNADETKDWDDQPRVRFMLLHDADSNRWYVIPSHKKSAFYEWLGALEAGDQVSDDLDFVRVAGPHCVTFGDWEETK